MLPVRRAALALLVALCTYPALGPAGERDPTRESPNLAVFGIDELEQPTHRESFAMLQYTPDPIEGVNRKSFALTKGAIDWLVRPLAAGWRWISPEPVRRSLDNFFFNLGYPGRLVSLLLQAELPEAGVETGHFVVNTTIGIAGFFDPAARIGIPTYRQDVGLAFASWGAGPGFYFVIPVLGPSSGRDGLGRLFDTALHPATYVPGLGPFLNLNAFTFRIDGYDSFKDIETDLYLAARALWSIQRTIQVERFEIPPEAFASADPEPSLGVLLLAPRDPAFLRMAKQREVSIPSTGRELPYSLWLQPEPAPLLFLIPGIGSHRNSRTPVALAELAFERGFSVVTVSSPFNPEFLLNALQAPYPGYTPADAEDLYAALSEIRVDLEARWPGRFGGSTLMGYSLGGIATLFVAGQEPPDSDGGLHFERFLAINPPVDLRFAARAFDTYFDAPLRWPEEERDRRVRLLAMKTMLVAQNGIENGLPFDRIESEFLVGLAGRTTVVSTLGAIEARGAPAHVGGNGENRGPLLQQINESSLDRYIEQLVFPYYAERFPGTPLETLAERSGLRTHERLLRHDARVHVVTNADDFILGDANLEWLSAVMDERLTVFPEGGHLGNLHLEPMRQAISTALGLPEVAAE